MADGTVGVKQAVDADRQIDNEVLLNEFGTTVYRQKVASAAARVDQRFEWQAVGGENRLLYMGTAPPGAGSDDSTWVVEKYTYAAGPLLGTNVITLIQRRIGSWDDRATLF